MTNKSIENKIKNEIEAQAPNNFSAIASACKSSQTKGKVITMKKNRKPLIIKMIAVAAMLVLVLSLSIASIISVNAVETVISLDVNPGIEISVGKNDKVRKLVATNDDGEAIITDLDVKGKTLDEALDLLLARFVEEGYISADTNSLLVSVKAKKLKNTDELSQRITDSINGKLTEAGVEASILTQVVSEHDEIEALAEEYEMSFGKARLIYELVQKDGRHTFEELSALTVHELHLLLKETKLIPEDVKAKGEISESELITKDEALDAALAEAGLEKDAVSDIEIEFDYLKSRNERKGILVYDVEFESEDTEFEFDVDAKTGEILKSKNEPVDEEDKPEKGEKPEENEEDEENEEKYKGEKRPENLIGKEEAFKQAFDKKGLNAEDFDEVEFDVDFKGDKWQYEIEFEKNGEKQKVKIDAVTGEVITPADKPAA